MILFQWAVLAWSWGGLVAPGVGQERSHAAWRSFCSKTMLPMQRGARSWPRGWRQQSARSNTKTPKGKMVKVRTNMF